MCAPLIITIVYALARLYEVIVRKGASGSIHHKYTLGLLTLSNVLLIAFAVYQSLHAPVSTCSAIGAALFIVSAFALRNSAAKALGKLWSVHIEIRSEHQVIQTGPYKYVRHPIYSSILLEDTGLLILAAFNPFALAAFVLLQLPALAIRIRHEEKLMLALPGYADYTRSTGSVIPKLFKSKQ